MSGPMGGLGIGATLASGFLSAAGDIFTGKAEQGMYNYKAGMALQRAQVQGTDVGIAYQSGESKALAQGTQTGQVVGRQLAGQGAGNIGVSSGSAAKVRGSQIWAGQVEQANTRTTAARQAYGHEVQQATDVSEASADVAAGETSKTSAGIAAASSILGAIGSVSSKWTQGQQAGLWGSSSDGSELVGGA